MIALPLALVAGLLRARLARGAVGDLVIELEHTPTSGLRDALARALGDPSLAARAGAARRRLRRRRRPAGRAALNEPAPRGDEDRARRRGRSRRSCTTRRCSRSRRCVQGVGAAAHLALENARLQAELRAQLTLVEESRARIVAAGDEQRRRIERDLHDGAQQRLVAIALELRGAQRRMGGDLDPARRAAARRRTVDDLQVAVEELRELAHGIHPTILAEGGLAAALDTLAARSPLPVTVAPRRERFPPDVEADAYFVACEALANVAQARERHAGDRRGALRERDAADRGRRRRRRRREPRRRHRPARAGRPGRGARRAPARREPARRRHAHRGGDPVRIVIAEDSVLLREGLAKLLEDEGFEVVGRAGDADDLLLEGALVQPGRRDRGRAHAADAHRRGRPRRGHDPRAAPRRRRARCSRRSSRRRSRCASSPSRRPASATC